MSSRLFKIAQSGHTVSVSVFSLPFTISVRSNCPNFEFNLLLIITSFKLFVYLISLPLIANIPISFSVSMNVSLSLSLSLTHTHIFYCVYLPQTHSCISSSLLHTTHPLSLSFEVSNFVSQIHHLFQSLFATHYLSLSLSLSLCLIATHVIFLTASNLLVFNIRVKVLGDGPGVGVGLG